MTFKKFDTKKISTEDLEVLFTEARIAVIDDKKRMRVIAQTIAKRKINAKRPKTTETIIEIAKGEGERAEQAREIIKLNKKEYKEDVARLQEEVNESTLSKINE